MESADIASLLVKLEVDASPTRVYRESASPHAIPQIPILVIVAIESPIKVLPKHSPLQIEQSRLRTTTYSSLRNRTGMFMSAALNAYLLHNLASFTLFRANLRYTNIGFIYLRTKYRARTPSRLMSAERRDCCPWCTRHEHDLHENEPLFIVSANNRSYNVSRRKEQFPKERRWSPAKALHGNVERTLSSQDLFHLFYVSTYDNSNRFYNIQLNATHTTTIVNTK